MKLLPRYWWIFLIYAFIIFLISVLSEWNDDAIAYSFFIPLTGEDQSFTPITSLTDIWNSQINHYLNSNGRFIIHFIVQIFCGLIGKYWFALFNAAVWGILLYSVSSFYSKQYSCYFAIICSSFLIILFFSVLPFTPPFQINYVWVACAVIIWIKFFLKNANFESQSLNTVSLIILSLYSFLTGELHEGFSSPLGGAVIYYFILKKFRLSKRQWVMAIFFAIGSLISIFAPGNFWRLNEEASDNPSVIYLVENFPYILWMPVILLIIIHSKKEFRKLFQDTKVRFFFIMALVSLIFNLIIGSLGRGILVYNFALIIITLRYIRQSKDSRILISSLIVASCIVMGVRIYNTDMQNRKTKEILKEYALSDSGNIFIDDNLFLFNHLETTQRRNTYTNKLRQQNPDKAFLKIYPKSIQDIEFMKDTNMVIKISDQSWICIQSASNPKKFIVEKTFLPSLLNRRMSPRILDFNSKNPIFIDSTATYKSLLYINKRPYISASVGISD